MHTKNQCFSEEEIYSFVADLSENQVLDVKIQAHLDDCEACNDLFKIAHEIDHIMQDNLKNPGDVFTEIPNIENFKICSLIGMGGMGKVYKALDSDLDRLVAIKVMNKSYDQDEEFKKRFRKEAKLVAQLNHQNIVQLYHIGIENDEVYLVMEYVDGCSLNRMMNSNISMEKKLDIAYQVIKGIKAAHAQGIVHRDIKPSNIMISKQGDVKLLDFGVAGTMSNNLNITITNQVLGTVGYMSPEVASGDLATTESDIYSLGVVFFELFTGERPFDEQRLLKLLDRIKSEDIPSCKEINHEIPMELDQIIKRMCSRNLSKRYSDLAEVERDFLSLKTGDKSNNFANTNKISFQFKFAFARIALFIFAISIACYILIPKTIETKDDVLVGSSKDDDVKSGTEKAGPSFDPAKVSEKQLFPLYGVMIGKTTSQELEEMGGVKSKKYNSFTFYGENFWIKDGLFEHIYMTRTGVLPNKWKKFGFDWKFSYDQWIQLLEYHGFTVTGSDQELNNKTKNNSSIFKAKIKASRRDPVPITIDLQFDFRQGNKNTNGTLYSIRVKSW